MAQEKQSIDEEIGKFGMWVNNNVVGRPITLVLAIASVVIVYACIPIVGGYGKWNTGLGLFFNTLSSSFELITGVGAVVGVTVLHAKGKKRDQSIGELHEKVEAVGGAVALDYTQVEHDVARLAELQPGPDGKKLADEICARLKS